MNTITYHDKVIIEGPQNFFRLTIGTLPSFGFFRMLTSDVDYILDTLSGAAGILTLSDGTNTVTLNDIYLVKAQTISPGELISDVVLADQRILWPRVYGTADYNTYKIDRTVGTAEFELENLNSGSEWTFTELATALQTLLGFDTFNFLTPTRKPRNILGNNVPSDCILRQFLIATQSYLAIDISTTSFIGSVYPYGAAEQSVDTTLLTTYENLLQASSTMRTNPLVQCAATAKMLSAANPADTGSRLLTYGSDTIAAGYGNFFIPSDYAVFGDEENSAALTTIGSEIAGEYADSFANTYRENKYAGLLPFTLNRAIHEITWQSNAQGAITIVKSFRPQEKLLERDLPHTLFSYDRYLLGAGAGGTDVRSAKIQTSGIPSNTTGPITCKLLDDTGAETGDAIDVYPADHLGSNNLDSGNITPNLSVGDILPIYQDLDGEWYTTFVFEDTIDCTCGDATDIDLGGAT